MAWGCCVAWDAGAARVAAISERVIMTSRMPRPRAILAPRLRAMVCAIVLNALCGDWPSLRDAGPNLGGGDLSFLWFPAAYVGLATARRCCGGSH